MVRSDTHLGRRSDPSDKKPHSGGFRLVDWFAPKPAGRLNPQLAQMLLGMPPLIGITSMDDRFAASSSCSGSAARDT